MSEEFNNSHFLHILFRFSATFRQVETDSTGFGQDDGTSLGGSCSGLLPSHMLCDGATMAIFLGALFGAKCGSKCPDPHGLSGFLSKSFDRKPLSPSLLVREIQQFTCFCIFSAVSSKAARIGKHSGKRASEGGLGALTGVPGHLFSMGFCTFVT